MLPSHVQYDWDKVGEALQDYTYMFHKVWSMGIPSFSDALPTAAVGFDHAGNHISFLFNPKFWKSLTQYQRAFIVAHESLHVILEHGIRAVNAKIPQLSNIAMDVVVNHMLTDVYGFDRAKLGKMGAGLCWLDTVFKPDTVKNVLWGQNYEYYYSLLEQNAEFVTVDLDSIDGHGHLPTIPIDKMGQRKNGQGMPKDIQGEIDEAKKKDDPTDPSGTKAGTGAGNEKDTVATVVRVKRSWKEIFQHLATIKRKAPDVNEQWARQHRRVSMLDSRLMIPSDFEVEEAEAPEKIHAHLFMDVSGSCWSFRDRFVEAYNTIPKDLFEVKVFQFDTRVSPVTVHKDGSLGLTGGGGTSFYPIEEYIRANNKEYPGVIMIFTDGQGDNVHPKKPENWFWFLGGRANYTYYIPKKSHTHYLKDVVA